MLKLTHVTSNDGKYREAQKIFPGLERMKLVLPELQTLDHKELIRAKLEAAKTMVSDVKERIIIAEDGACYFDNFGKNSVLPGPLCKYFNDEIGAEGLWKIAQAFNVTRAHMEVMMGILVAGGEKVFFAGRLEGSIVAPRGRANCGFDMIFQRDGQGKTYAEMTDDERNNFSDRGIVLRQLKEYLESHRYL